MANLVEILLTAKGSLQVKDDMDEVTAAGKRLKAQIASIEAQPITPGSTAELEKLEGALKDLAAPLAKAKEAFLDGFDPKAVAALNREAQGLASISPILGALVGKIGKIYAAWVIAKKGAELAALAIKSVAQQEQSINRLNIALQTMGAYSAAASKDMQDFADQMKRTSRFSDQAVLSAAALIAQLGRLQGQALKDATQAAADLAVGLGRDLSTAALIVAKAAQGSTFELRKYGLVLDDNIPKTERWTATLQFLTSKFGGVAKGEVRTASASFQQFKNALQDTFEVLGAPLVIAFLPALKKATEAMFGFVQIAKKIPKIRDLFDPADLNLDKALKGLDLGFLEDKYRRDPVEIFFRFLQDPFQISSGPQGFAKDLTDQFNSIRIAVNKTVLSGSITEAVEATEKLKSTADRLALAFGESAKEVRFLRREAERAKEALTLRFAVDATAAQTEVDRLLRSLEILPKTVEVQIGRRSDVKDAKELVDQILSTPGNVQIVQDGWWDSISKGNGEWQKMLAYLPELKKRVADAIDSKDMEKLLKVGEEVTTTLRNLTAGSTPKAFDAASIEGARQLLGYILELDAVLPLAAKGIVENEAVTRIDALSDSIRAMTRQQLPDLKLVKPEDIPRAENLTKALERLRTEADAFKKVKDVGTAQSGYEKILFQLANLEKQFPETAIQISLFRQELTTTFGREFKILLDASQAKRALDIVRDAAKQVRDSLDAKSFGAKSLFDSQAITSTTTDISVMNKEFAKLVDTSVKLGQSDVLEKLFGKASEELRKLTVAVFLGAEGLDELIDSWLNVQKATKAGIATLAPLQQLDAFTLQFNTAIDLKDFDAAILKFGEMITAYDKVKDRLAIPIQLQEVSNLKAAVDKMRAFNQALLETSPSVQRMEQHIFNLYVQLAKLPTDIKIRVEIEKSEKTLKDIKKIDAQIESTIAGLKDMSVEFLAVALATPFRAMTSEAEDFAEGMRNIFKKMVDDLISYLAKLAALKIFKFIIDAASGGTTSFIPFPAPPFASTGKGGPGNGNFPPPQGNGNSLVPPPTSLLDFSRNLDANRELRLPSRPPLRSEPFDLSELLPRLPPPREELHIHTPDVRGLVQAYRTGELGNAQAVAARRPRRSV